jgi:hypothetical protein
VSEEQVQESSVFEGVTVGGRVNTEDETILKNVESSIRRGYPQVWPVSENGHRVALVGGGPSLNRTIGELRDLVYAGAKIVALNGAYQWCLDHNFQPRAHVLLDARPESAKLVGPPVPDCRYYVCSQCAPETWEALGTRQNVAIWHAAGEASVESVLDAYYMKSWVGIPGGTTVGTRAIALMRTMGFLRFDCFGLDSCWMDDAHHAYAQTQNDRDGHFRVTIQAKDSVMPPRDFCVAPWHLKQLEDLVLFIRAHGNKVLLNFHGDGLLAYALAAHADVHYTVHKE